MRDGNGQTKGKGAHGEEGSLVQGSYTVDAMNKADYPMIRFHRNPHLSDEHPNNLHARVDRFAVFHGLHFDLVPKAGFHPSSLPCGLGLDEAGSRIP